MNRKKNLSRTGWSTAGLLAAFTSLQLLQWMLVSAGMYLSGFHGNIHWQPFTIQATAGHWTWQQVMFLYFIPYLTFLLLWLLFKARRKVMTDKPLFYHLFIAWLFLLLLVKVFFFPFWQVIYKSGIYYPLAWMGMTKTQQTGLAVFLLVLFIINAVGVSPLFGFALDKRGKTFLHPAEIRRQLFFLWLVPFVLFSLFLFCCAGTIMKPDAYLTGGIAVSLIINLPVISRYKVIVN